MKRALELAERGWGTTHPNPMVGCVIVRDGKLVAEGWHEISGGPHAEKMAIAHANAEDLQGATLYVTLEPCSTHGRTGACTTSIINAGIRRVVIGALDPNPEHRGAAIPILQARGIEVSSGCCEEESQRLNWIFNHWIVNKQPLVAGKVATTLDGKIATRSGHSQWITCAEARQDVMRWRKLFPAIAVGAGTVLADNPALTIRLPEEKESCAKRLILDRSGKLLDRWQQYKVFTDEFQEQTIWITRPISSNDSEQIAQHFRGRVWHLSNSALENPVVLWDEVLKMCAEAQIYGIWVEGGKSVLSSLLAAQKLHALWHYRAPLFLADDAAPGWIGGQAPHTLQNGFHLSDVKTEQFGTNQLMRGLVCYPSF